jgi:hypothetical protein
LFGRAIALAIWLACCGGWVRQSTAQEPPARAEAPNDTLRIDTDREQLLFAPGEEFGFDLTAQVADVVPGTTLDIRTTLSPARQDKELWKSDQRLEVPVEGQPHIRLKVPLPGAEGVYTVRLAAIRPSGFRDRFFGAPTPLAERSFDVVVLAAQPPAANEPPEWNTVLEIDPTSPRWWERLPTWTQLRRIPGLNHGPLGSLRAASVELPLGRFVELPPTVPGMDPHWQAYSLPLEAAGTPHLLEIEYPADQEQHFGISIVEPNAAGVIDGSGRDGGVYVEGFGRSEVKATHQLVFWPRTQAPLLLMTNAHPAAAAHFGHIRVRKLNSGRLAATTPDRLAADRLVAAYIARPLVAETFGASETLDSSSGTAPATRHDWQTMYEGATRLAEYVHYGGYNSAVISVLTDGHSIFPSSKLMPTPWHHGGQNTAGTSRRDALELMLRVFDREGLALLPALQLTAPLPELEKLRRDSNPQTSGLEWVGPDGRSWLASQETKNGLAADYNLLDPRVQQAVVHVVDELVARYGHHRSFAGLAVQLSARGYGQLPPLEWGLDDATVGRFERETGLRLAAAGPGRFAARRVLLTGEHAAAWRAWRAARVSQFYEQLAKTVRATGDGRRLLITLEESFAHPQLAARIRPVLIGENRVEAALLDAGLDRRYLERVPGLVICPARAVRSMLPLSDAAVDLEMNQAAATWHRDSDPAGTAAAVLYHRPQRRRLASFEAKSPIRVTGQMTLARHSLAQGAAVRQPYVHALLDHDPHVLLDGGELLPLGQEERLRAVRRILRQLPTAAQVTEHAAQPVFVRSYAEPSGTTLLVVNACPWPAEAEVMLEADQPATLAPLPEDPSDTIAAAPAARQLAAGKQPWALSLEPYAIEAVRIASPGVKVAGVGAEVSEAGQAELAARLADLANRDLTAPHLVDALANPSFEPLSSASPVPGWLVSGEGATAELDATTPQDGKTCVYFHGGGHLAALESESFATPPTGQLAMTVFARCQNIDAHTEMRIIFAADHAGQEYRRSFVVGGAQAGSQRLEPQWRPYAILVNDLPLNLQSRMRVRFELTGPGEVWLDNVKLYDLLFPLKFYPNAQAEIKQFFILIHAAQRAVEDERVADSVRLLESYWPRFITAYTPPVEPPIAAESRPQDETSSAPPTDEQQQPAPSMSERIKRFLPLMR